MQSLMARMAGGSAPEVSLQRDRDIPVEVVETSPRDLDTHIPEDRNRDMFREDSGSPQRDRNIPEYTKDSGGVVRSMPDRNIPQDRDSAQQPWSYADEEEKENYDQDVPKAMSNIRATLPTQVCKVEIGNEVRAPPPDIAPTLRTEPLSGAPSQAPDGVTQNQWKPGVAATRIDPTLHVTAPVLQSQTRSDERLKNNTDTDVKTSLGNNNSNPGIYAETRDADVKEPVSEMQDSGSAGDSSEESESETGSSEEYDTHTGDKRGARDQAGKIDSSPLPTSDKPTAIDSFLTEFEDEPFARRIGRGVDRLSPEPVVKSERADTLHAPQPVAQIDSGPIASRPQPVLAELEEEPFARRVSSRERPLEVPDSSRSPEHSAAKIPKKDSDDVYPRAADTAEHEQSPEESDLHSESDTESESGDRSPDGSDIKSSVDAEREKEKEKENKLDLLLTEFEEEPFARRRGGSGRFSAAPRGTDFDDVPSRESKAPPHRETDVDSDSSAFTKPPVQELEQEPFPMRRWGSGRFTGSRETDIDAETPRGLETQPDRDMQSNRDSKVPRKPEPYLDQLEEEPFSRRKRTSDTFSAPRETNLDDVLPSKPQPYRDSTQPERDSKMAKKSDPFLEELDEEPFARRPRGRRDTPSMKSDNEFDRSGRSSDFDRSARSHDFDGSARRDDPDRSGRSHDLDRSGRSHDLDRSGRSHDPDRSGRSRDLDRSGRSNDYDRSRKSSDHDRSDTESHRSGGRPDSDYDRNTRRKSETSSIDSFLTELDEEPFARRAGRRRRRRSPDRTTSRNAATTEPKSSDVGEVVEPPAVSKPSYASSPPPKEDTKIMAVVPESPTVSLPPLPPSFRGPNVTSTPQKPDTRVEARKSLPVPESPTICMPPVYEEEFPQARMCVNTVSTYTTTGGTSYSPFTDASVSSAVEQMPRGYSFVRCESEITRSERRLVRVDRPLAPDFETLINSVPFTSETVGGLDDEDAVGFDDYSAFVQDLHRPSSETELGPLAVSTGGLPAAPSPLDDACILSGNLVSPPPVEMFEFPQHKHPRLPAVSSVAHRLHGRDDDSEDQGSDAGAPNYADKDKSSKAEASGSEGVLDASFDIDSTEARDKMASDFAFLTSGNSVRVPERVSAPPSDSKARRDLENIDDRMSPDERLSGEDDRDRRTDDRSDDDDEEEGSRRRRRRRRRKEGSGDRGDDRKRRRNNRKDREDDRNEYPEERQDSRRDERRRESPERETERDIHEDRDRPEKETEYKTPSRQSQPQRTTTPLGARTTEPEKKFTSSEQARDVITKTEKSDTHVAVSDRPTAKLEEAAPLLFFQPAAASEQVVTKTNTEPPITQPQRPTQASKTEDQQPPSKHLASPEDDIDLPFADSDEEMAEKAAVNKRPAAQEVPVARTEERREQVYRTEAKREQSPFRTEEKRESVYRTEEKREPVYRTEEKREQAPIRTDEKREQAPFRTDEKSEPIYRTEEKREQQPIRTDEKTEPVYRTEEKREQAPFRVAEKKEPVVKHEDRREPSFIGLERGPSDRREEKIELPKRSEVKREQPDRSDDHREPEDRSDARKELSERREAEKEPSTSREEKKIVEGAKSSLEPSPQIVITPDSSDRLATLPPRPKPRQGSLTRPTPMPRSKSLGDNISTATGHSTDDEDDVFQRGTSHASDDSHSSLDDDDEEEELAFTKKQSTPQTYEEKRPRSLKEIRRKMTQQRSNPRPLIAPFTLPDNMVLPSRLKIQAQRKQFLSSDNLDTKGLAGSLQDQFAAHKLSQQQAKERRYKSPNKKLRSPNLSSQDQLEKLHYMLNYSRHSESSFDRSLVDHLHEGCILTPQGRRSILDKTLSIENLQVDLPEHLRRYGSVTSLVETDIDTGETQETSFFPETNLDIFDCLFQPHEPLQRSASMSDMVLGDPDQGQGEGQGQSEALDRSFHGLRMSLPPSQSHKSTGKGRFAYRKYQKSKSLCTLETNLDDVGEEGGGDGDMKRVPSVHELRVTKSLQKLNVPDWFKKSSLSKSSSCLLKYGSNSTMNSFTFSPSLLSSPCASTAPAPSNVVIKTRVVPPSSSRGMRSPALGSSTMLAAGDKKAPPPPVKLPSEKLREKEKNKSLMPIPIVPFAEIRAMFEKKGKGKKAAAEKEGEAVNAEKARPTESARDVASPDRATTGKHREELPKHGILKTPAVPAISISPEEEMKREQQQLQPHHHHQQQQQQQQQQREYRPAQQTFTVARDAQSPMVSIAPQSQPQTVHNGVSDGVSVTVKGVSPRTEQVAPPSIARPVADKPPSLSLRVDRDQPQEPARRDDAQQSPPPSKDSQKDGKKSPPPKSQDGKKSPPPKSQDGKKSPPAKDSKQQFSPGRSLRQFFGLSKDKSGERKSEGGGGSLDSSFSSGDGVYEKEPRRLGVSEISRRFEAPPRADSAASSSFERRSSGREGGRSDPDSSFSSGEGGVTDTSAPSRGSAPSQPTSSSFPASAGFRPPAHHHQNNNTSDPVRQPGFIDYGRSEPGKQPPFSRINRPELDSSSEEPYSSRPRQPEAREPSRPEVRDPPSFQRRLPGAGTSYGRTPSTENGDHQPDSLSVPAAGAKGAEKKSLKETTV